MEKLLRLNLEARLALEGGQDRSMGLAGGPKLGGGLTTGKFLRIFRLHRSNKADIKMFAREHTKVNLNPDVCKRTYKSEPEPSCNLKQPGGYTSRNPPYPSLPEDPT